MHTLEASIGSKQVAATNCEKWGGKLCVLQSLPQREVLGSVRSSVVQTVPSKNARNSDDGLPCHDYLATMIAVSADTLAAPKPGGFSCLLESCTAP